MAFKFPCDMTEDEKEVYHAKRFAEDRERGAKRFGLKLDEVLHRIGITLSPMALFAVGLQFKPTNLGEHWRPLVAGLGWALLRG